MRKSLVFWMLGLSCILLSSCKDDDELNNVPDDESSFTFQGKTISLKDGLIDDYGPINLFGDEATHWNYDFTVVDGSINLSTEDVDNFKGGLYVELFNPSNQGFQTGTFTYSDDVESQNSVGNFVFEIGGLGVDLNGDNDVEDNGEFLEFTGGTVTVSGPGGVNNTYTIRFDVTIEGGTEIDATYTGNFKYFLDE